MEHPPFPVPLEFSTPLNAPPRSTDDDQVVAARKSSAPDLQKLVQGSETWKVQ